MNNAGKVAVVSCAVLALALIGAAFALPPFGNPVMDSGGFILKTEAQARKAANIVCAVVLDYRGYDTLGEATILLAAIAGAAALLKVKAR